MEIHLKVNVEELLGKSKELDFVKVMKLWKQLQKGEEITFLDGNIKLQKVEDQTKSEIPKELREAMEKSIVKYGSTSKYGEFLK